MSVNIALPNVGKLPILPEHPPVELFKIRRPMFEIGITEVDMTYGKMRIYDKERVVCDFIRLRHQLGEDVALEVLRSYMSGAKNIQKLYEYAEKMRIKRVNAVVDWFGPIDFLSMDSQYETSGVKRLFSQTGTDDSAESKYIGGNITKNITQTQKANATNYITPSDPPFFIQHGSIDSLVPTQQSINFAEALTKVLGGDKVTLEIIQGADHGTSEFNTKENIEKVIAFLDKYLK